MAENCHHFVVSFLNRVAYNGRSDWTVPGVCVAVLRFGSHTSMAGAAKSWLPFVAVMLLGCWLLGARFLLAWLAGLVLLAGTFSFASRQQMRTDHKPSASSITVLPTSHGAATV